MTAAHLITIDGITRSLSGWSDIIGGERCALSSRIHRNGIEETTQFIEKEYRRVKKEGYVIPKEALK